MSRSNVDNFRYALRSLHKQTPEEIIGELSPRSLTVFELELERGTKLLSKLKEAAVARQIKLGGKPVSDPEDF